MSEPNQDRPTFFDDGEIDLTGFGVSTSSSRPKDSQAGAYQVSGPTAFVSKTQEAVPMPAPEPGFFAGDSASVAGNVGPLGNPLHQTVDPVQAEAFAKLQAKVQAPADKRIHWVRVGIIAGIVGFILLAAFLFYAALTSMRISAGEEIVDKRELAYEEETGNILRWPGVPRERLPLSRQVDKGAIDLRERKEGEVYESTVHTYRLKVKKNQQVTIYVKDLEAKAAAIDNHRVVVVDAIMDDDVRAAYQPGTESRKIEGRESPVGPLNQADTMMKVWAPSDGILLIDVILDARGQRKYALYLDS